MNYTVHGILQARILECAAVPFSRGSSQPRSPALQADSLLSEPLELLKDSNKRQINWIVQTALEILPMPIWKGQKGQSHEETKDWQKATDDKKPFKALLTIRKQKKQSTLGVGKLVFLTNDRKKIEFSNSELCFYRLTTFPTGQGWIHKVTEGKGSVDTTHGVLDKCWTKLPSTHCGWNGLTVWNTVLPISTQDWLNNHSWQHWLMKCCQPRGLQSCANYTNLKG